jgi:hypothetical protein
MRTNRKILSKKAIHFSVIILLTILIGHKGYGQFSKRIFLIECREAGLRFTRPDGFIEMDTTTRSFFTYTKEQTGPHRKYLYPFDYEMASVDTDMIIGIIVMKIDLKKDSSPVLKAMFAGQTANTDYLLKIRWKADTINEKVVFFSPAKSRQLYNADISGTYLISMERPFECRFDSCRIAFMHRKDTGDAEVYYFYNRSSREKMEKLYQHTSSILRYEDTPVR